jgi:IS5 family transposase
VTGYLDLKSPSCSFISVVGYGTLPSSGIRQNRRQLTTRCGEGAVAGLNEALWAKAAGDGLLRTARVRADATLIYANVVYTTDSGLLAKAVGKLVCTARRAQAIGGAPATVMTDRRPTAARRRGRSQPSCATAASRAGRRLPRPSPQ